MLDSIKDAIQDIRSGKMVVVVDDENRENEGDLVMAAEFASEEAVNFMANYGRGMICAPISKDQARKLELAPMVSNNTSAHETAFTVTIDIIEGCTTGISAADRSATLKRMASPEASAEEFQRPGHIFPLVAKDGGVIEREGHTEAAVDLAKLAGLRPAGVICEIMNADGTMARLDDLKIFAQTHGLKLISIEDLKAYRLREELVLSKDETINFPTRFGNFQLHHFSNTINGEELVAITKGDISNANPGIIARIHSQCFTGDVMGSLRCDCGDQLHHALEMIERNGEGIVVYEQTEGRGIGLKEKIRAYRLQEQGLDTVEANLELGHQEDQRDYASAAQVLKYFGLSSVKLITNNPDKRKAVEDMGIQVQERIPSLMGHNTHNHEYLLTKSHRMGHELETPLQ